MTLSKFVENEFCSFVGDHSHQKNKTKHAMSSYGSSGYGSSSYGSSSYGSYGTYFNSDSYQAYIRAVTIIVCSVLLIMQVVGVAFIYCYIRCCCPTALRRVRPGLVLSDAPTAVQPFVLHQHLTPVESGVQTISNRQIAPEPPQYPGPGAWDKPTNAVPERTATGQQPLYPTLE